MLPANKILKPFQKINPGVSFLPKNIIFSDFVQINEHFWLILIYSQWCKWRGSEGRINPLASKTSKIGHHLACTVEFPYNQGYHTVLMGVRINFSRGGQHRHFADPFSGCERCNANGPS